jgi:hydroxymethylbilane synthase
MNLKIGTRRSDLALWQANYVADRLKAAHPGLTTELVTYKTTGDHILDRPLAEIGGKGLFTKELEEGLDGGEIHFAVHSLKDMPTTLPEGMVLGSIPVRADVRDCVIRRLGDETDPGTVGTASLRRMCLAKRRWAGTDVQSIRGNVQTRLNRVLAEGDRRVDAVILALAGILRLNLTNEVEGVEFLPLNPEKWIPAVGQGALAIECRAEDETTLKILQAIHHEPTARCTRAERSFLRAVEGDCRVPVGAYATADGDNIRLRAFIGSPDGEHCFVETDMGTEPKALGETVAQTLLNAGGAEVLAALRQGS